MALGQFGWDAALRAFAALGHQARPKPRFGHGSEAVDRALPAARLVPPEPAEHVHRTADASRCSARCSTGPASSPAGRAPRLNGPRRRLPYPSRPAWPPPNATTTRSSASSAPPPTPRSSAPTASSPSSGTPTSTATRPPTIGSPRSTRRTRCCRIPSGAGATTCSGGPASAAAARAGFEAFGGFSDIFDAFFGGGAAAARRRDDAAGRCPGRIFATTCGSRSRRRSRGPRRRSSSRSSSAARRAIGSGAKPGSEPTTCPQCNGRGEVRSIRQTMLGQMVNVSACPRCGGEGRIVETPCETCHGEGRTERRRTLRVTIPPGHRRGPPDPPVERGRGGAARRRGRKPVRGRPRPAAPVAQARRHGALLRGPGLDRPGGARDEDHGPDGRRRRGGRDQAGHPAGHRDPAARQGRAAPAPRCPG